MIKLAIFDFGDTLSDAKGSNKITQKECVEQKVLEKKGYVFSKEELVKAKLKMDEIALTKSYIEQRKDKHIYVKILLEILGIPYSDEFVHELENEFWKSRIKNTQLFPTTKETLKKLKEKGINLAVISNANDDHNATIAKNLEIFDLFDEFILSYKFEGIKSELKIFKQLLEKFPEIKANECIMVGNDLNEDTYAKKLGMKTAILTKAMRKDKRKEHLEPDYYIDNLSELLEIVK